MVTIRIVVGIHDAVELLVHEAHQPGGPGQQGQRLLAGAEPCREQMLIDVQEHHHVRPGDHHGQLGIRETRLRVEHLGAKEALLAEGHGAIFTIPHFSNYAAVLVLLDEIQREELDELIVDAWLARAPVRLAKDYLDAAP